MIHRVTRFHLIATICLLLAACQASAQEAGDSGLPAAGNRRMRPDSLPAHRKDSTAGPIRVADSMRAAGTADSLRPRLDSPAVAAHPDSLAGQAGWTRQPRYDSFRAQVYDRDFPFGFVSGDWMSEPQPRKPVSKDWLFYSLTGLVLVFALLRLAFAKYFQDLFRLFFRTTLKQRQITEQLSQTPLPSLVFNLFFLVTGGLYIDFVLQHFNRVPPGGFRVYFLYAAGGLGLIYLGKFLVLKILGWIFNIPTASNAYIFIVFVINKVIGVFLLPFLVLLAFTDGTLYQVSLFLSAIGVGGLYLYRFFLSYAAVRNQVKVKPFHFLVYVLSCEVAPLLLIYKLLLRFLF
ncbi:MAG TPA: DUF4271 domain-containing protein [Chitinophagaceae bacterium]|nr:DUF4271 domain-containing protein [Chitinophagaceae bacterium]